MGDPGSGFRMLGWAQEHRDMLMARERARSHRQRKEDGTYPGIDLRSKFFFAQLLPG